MRRTIASLALLLASAGTARAADTWSDPFPGVRRLHRDTADQNLNVLVVDLCAPGVSMRATADGERGRTVSSFGNLVGADAAVNGDFFSFSNYSTNGPSMSGGAAWGGEDHGYVAPLAFGAHRVSLAPHEATGGVEPWMQEVVSGHPTLLVGGAPRDNNGDPLCTNRHPRTAVGLSADQRTLYLVVIDGRATGRIGMTCDEMIALFQELGASDAMNLDGGGSSTMWIKPAGVVNFPSDGSQRVVGNHLGLRATGAGDAPNCPNRAPRGWLDGATCDAITGWAQDEDAPEQVIDVHLYFDGEPGATGAQAISAHADVARDDLCAAIGSCAHGYQVAMPAALRDGQPHQVRVYGIDSAGGENPALAGGPLELTCATPVPPVGPVVGRLRHVGSPEILTAWRMGFIDVATLPEATVAAYAHGDAWPGSPMLVRATGEPAVYLLDGDVRRHVTSPASMTAWRLDYGAIVELTPEALALHPLGVPLPAAPFLLRGDGPAVYVLDQIEAPLGTPGDPPAEDADPAGGCRVAPAGRAGAGAFTLLALLAALAVLWSPRLSLWGGSHASRAARVRARRRPDGRGHSR